MSAFGCQAEAVREIAALRAANRDLQEWFDASERDRKELLQFVRDFVDCDSHDGMMLLYKMAEKLLEAKK